MVSIWDKVKTHAYKRQHYKCSPFKGIWNHFVVPITEHYDSLCIPLIQISFCLLCRFFSFLSLTGLLPDLTTKCIWVTKRTSYKKQELFILCEQLGSIPIFLWDLLIIFLVFCVVFFLFCLSSFCVLCPMLPVSLDSSFFNVYLKI